MRLKTKFQDEDFELGEVVEGVIVECLGKHEKELRVIATAANGGQHTFYYSSIKKFMDDWEDAPEEPKGIIKVEKSIFSTCMYIVYSTEEEAEKAVEKLKAWKRLKDKGLSFRHWKEAQLRPHSSCIAITGNMECDAEARKDLDLLFGGEE